MSQLKPDSRRILLVGTWPVSWLADLKEATAGEFEIVCFRDDLRRIQELTRADEPCWLVVGANIPVFAIDSTIQAIRVERPAMRLATFGSNGDLARCQQWLQRGCDVYVSTQIQPSQFLQELALAQRGFIVIDEPFRGGDERRGMSQHGLTRREEQVLRLLMLGYKNERIGGELFISRSTVEFHVKNIFRKLAVCNRIEAL